MAGKQDPQEQHIKRVIDAAVNRAFRKQTAQAIADVIGPAVKDWFGRTRLVEQEVLMRVTRIEQDVGALLAQHTEPAEQDQDPRPDDADFDASGPKLDPEAAAAALEEADASWRREVNMRLAKVERAIRTLEGLLFDETEEGVLYPRQRETELESYSVDLGDRTIVFRVPTFEIGRYVTAHRRKA
jgi:hypothetical protein